VGSNRLREMRNSGGMPHQIKSWFGADVPGAVSHPTGQALTAKWMQIRSERDPILADFWHEADEAFVERSILFLRSDQDYVYLHHGAYLRGRIGFSMQGRSLSELRTRIRAPLMDVYDRSIEEFVIAYLLSFADFMHDVVLWGRLVLPLRLSANDPRVALLVYCQPIVDKPAILRALFERTRASTIIATPIKDSAGTVTDGWIVAINDEGSRLTGVVEHATGDLLLRHIPLFARDDLWAYLMERLPQQVATATVSDRTKGQTFNLQVEWLDDYIVIRATPLSETGDVFLID
jgi:hypothetical protein